ncbi:hypothetical protein THOM_0664 [Trachipleistophora hominis]|uniref:Uncharacterized protein n=1 Tax=Trachipleistophora hominis TaxID=72359 RepID=L7K006_TRAHO|nr:hypothetical protein THOM_0664 [Trachipleistophora hominis]
MHNLIILSIAILAFALRGVAARPWASEGVGIFRAECFSECGSDKRRHHRPKGCDDGIYDFYPDSSICESECDSSCREKERHVAQGRRILEKCIVPLVLEVSCRDLTERECEILLKAFDNLRQYIYKDFEAYEHAWDMMDPLKMYYIAFCNLVLYNNPYAIQVARCVKESKTCVGTLSLKICGDSTTFSMQGSVNFVVVNPIAIPLFMLKPAMFLGCPIEVDILLFKYVCAMLIRVHKERGVGGSGCHRGVSKLAKLFQSRCHMHDRNSVFAVKMVIIKLCVDIRQNKIDWSFKTYCNILVLKKEGDHERRPPCDFTAAINYYFGTIGSCNNTPCH